MSDINFTAKNLNLIGSDGYATIDSNNTIEINSKNYLNLNADTVGISTDITIGGQVASDLIIAEGFYLGIGTTNPIDKLTVRDGDISVGINTSHGLILTSPNGTQYRLIVDDAGALSTVAV
jgi:hypothetical protein